ncbi:hypothetical protein [Comamonas sp.]|uniref:hypothetical protein n=1 Tax=Comamonas sp. TaxID=34028 RepID=UPI00258F08EC|nr:hypothetical protein [Comamonas sp.]
MKETGLMFKAPLVHAILAGQKTQTRRLLKPQPAPNHPHDGGTKWVLERGLHTPVGSVGHLSVREKMGLRCPMGQPGDRIYVRETFVQGFKTDPSTGDLLQWGADGEELPMTTWFRATDGGISWSDDDGWETNVPWKPSIHMPKDLARIWLEITGVRVERLQDISNEDAIAEGVNRISHGREGDYYSAIRNEQHPKNWTYPDDAFRELWESTGGDWAANPWVWVIDFKTISTTGRPA